MRKSDVGFLPVQENGRLIGIVTDRDVCCRAVGDGHDLTTLTAREIMTTAPLSCFDDEDCVEAARLMKERRVHRLAVLDRTERLVGLLSVDDLARYSHDLAGEVLEATAPWPH
jgi:CBS domain-containing protein